MADKLAAHPDRGPVAELAERQYGVISAAQLYSLGLSRDQVAARTRAGWLHRLHRGVYAVGHRLLTPHAIWMAAVLACGEGTVLSHRSAAALWGLISTPMTKAPPDRNAAPGTRQIAEVTIPTAAGRWRRRQDITVRRSTTLRPDETTRHQEIPVTTVPRTLLDVAPVLPPRALERACDEAERLRLCDEVDLRAVATRHRGRPGAGALDALLKSHRVGTTATRSELEERFLALCQERGIPAPLVNVPLLGLTVDFHWPGEAVVVEVDGHASHATRRAFQDDRDRDTLLAAHGFRTLRFTWWDVTERPAVVANRLRRVLGARG